VVNSGMNSPISYSRRRRGGARSAKRKVLSVSGAQATDIRIWHVFVSVK
jgi:hypothetical protein